MIDRWEWSAYGPGYNQTDTDMSTHDNENNARLKPDVLAALAQQAQAENTTVDDLLDEAARGLLRQRENIGELRSFVAENRAEMKKRGFTERDVIPAIKEYRKQKRER
jgi:hypothetical protein